jgi:hypothetical protein
MIEGGGKMENVKVESFDQGKWLEVEAGGRRLLGQPRGPYLDQIHNLFSFDCELHEVVFGLSIGPFFFLTLVLTCWMPFH